MARETLVLIAGLENGSFQIWKRPEDFRMTGSTAEGTAEDDAEFFPSTRAATLLELLNMLVSRAPSYPALQMLTAAVHSSGRLTRAGTYDTRHHAASASSTSAVLESSR